MIKSEARLVPSTYFDWAATTPLCEEAASAMAPYFTGGPDNLFFGGNANSLHSIGRAAFSAMEQARVDLAACVNCRPDELYFTSGATEADDTALLGITHAAWEACKHKGDAAFVPHIIVSSIEHEAVLEPAHRLEREGVQVSYLKPNRAGFITPEALQAELRENTVLVSVMLANNEIGSVQDVSALARVTHAAGALMHTDAVQALAKVRVDIQELGVDAASFSAHKICGPKGIGALFVRKNVACQAFMLGGGQESGFRSGTQNVAGMVGFAAAAKAMCNEEFRASESKRLMALRDELYRHLSAFEGVRASVACGESSLDYLPNIANFVVQGIESETMILRLDRRGFAVSGGSACSSKSLAPNRVLTEIGLDKDSALCSLRVSMGRYTTSEAVEAFVDAFAEMLEWARS